MTLEKAKRQFKKHYKKAMKLKEGGAAWEREIKLSQKYFNIGLAKYQAQLERKYSN